MVLWMTCGFLSERVFGCFWFLVLGQNTTTESGAGFVVVLCFVRTQIPSRDDYHDSEFPFLFRLFGSFLVCLWHWWINNLLFCWMDASSEWGTEVCSPFRCCMPVSFVVILIYYFRRVQIPSCQIRSLGLSRDFGIVRALHFVVMRLVFVTWFSFRT